MGMAVDYACDFLLLLDSALHMTKFSAVDKWGKPVYFTPKIRQLYRATPNFNLVIVLPRVPLDLAGLIWVFASDTWAIVYCMRMVKLLQIVLVRRDIRQVCTTFYRRVTSWVAMLFAGIEYLRNAYSPKSRRRGGLLEARKRHTKVRGTISVIKATSQARMQPVSDGKSSNVSLTTSLFNVCGVMCLVVHLGACFWHLSRPTVITSPSTTAAQAYLGNVYFMVVAMMCVGYGDITPSTSFEVAFVMCIQGCGWICRAMLVGCMVPLLSNISSVRTNFQRSIADLRKWLLRMKIPYFTSLEILHHIIYFNDRYGEAHNTFEWHFLPPQLRGDLALDLCYNSLKFVPYLNYKGELFSRGLLKAIAMHMKPYTYSPDYTVLRSGDLNHLLYLVMHGTVIIKSEEANSGVDDDFQLGSGGFFGHVSFLWPEYRAHVTVTTHTYCEFLALHREDLLQCLSEYPKIKEHVLEHATSWRNKYLESLGHSSSGIKKASTLKVKLHYVYTNVKNTTRKSFKEISRKMILPTSRPRYYWSLCSLLIVLYNILVIPYRIAFSNEIDPVVLGIDVAFDVFFWVDIYLHARRFSVIDPTQEVSLISDPRKLGERYFHSSGFTVDFQSVLPIDLLVILGVQINNAVTGTGSASGILGISPLWFYLLRCNRLIRVYRIGKYVEIIKQGPRTQKVIEHFSGSFLQILLMICVMGVVLHFAGCGWMLISLVGEDITNTNWTKADTFVFSGSLSRHLRSLYFAYVTAATVGYGGILPTNSYEMTYIIFYIMLGTTSYLAVLASLTLIADNYSAAFLEHQRKMTVVNHFLTFREVNPALAARVQAYYDHLWYRQQGHQDGHMLDGIPGIAESCFCF